MACEEAYQQVCARCLPSPIIHVGGQGDEEGQLGLPKSPLCDRSLHLDFPRSQRGFLEFVVQPLMMALEEADVTENVTYDPCKFGSVSLIGNNASVIRCITASGGPV